MPMPDEMTGETSEQQTARDRSSQPALFEMGQDGRLLGHVALMPDLGPQSSFDIARYWYRRYLERSGHPRNTVNSYSYDLSVFEMLIGPKAVAEVKPRDIAYFLDDSNTRSTRKRRLTSISGLFKYLITQARVLEEDPTASFYPEHIPLKTPRPLFADEQTRLLSAATADGARAHAAIWLMLKLGLSRGEILQLRAEHVDLSDPSRPVVYIFYDNPRHRGRERKLMADAEFAAIYGRLCEEYPALDDLFPILPQSMNKLVERVALAAGLTKKVSPQSLRDSFAVDRARDGATEEDLLRLLGLADDARNRMSVQRYLKLGAPPLLGEGERDTWSSPTSSGSGASCATSRSSRSTRKSSTES